MFEQAKNATQKLKRNRQITGRQEHNFNAITLIERKIARDK